MAYILIVDDDDDFSSAAATVLQAAGHETATELTIKKGLKSVRAKTPDLLVLDVMFPEDNTAGFTMARTVVKEFPDLPILMLTAVNQKFPLGFSSKDIDDQFMPVTDFLEKPVDFDALRAKVGELLAAK